MTENYYMIRKFDLFYYTLESIIAIAILFIVLFIYIKKVDKESLFVFILAGLINSGVELMILGIGIRTIENAYFFGIPIGFPYISFILGFYEGGIKTLIGFHFVKYIINKERFNRNFFLFLVGLVFIAFFLYSAIIASQINLRTISITITARNMVSLLSILFLLLAFILSILYFIFKTRIPIQHKFSLLYYEIGVVMYLLAWMTPMHFYQLRYIGFLREGSYIPASSIEQFLLMYVYFLFFEGVGVNIMIYPLIYQFNLIKFQKAEK